MDTSKLKAINDLNADKALADKRHQDLLAQSASISDTVLSATISLIKYLEGHTTKTLVVNQLKSINTPDALRIIPYLEKLDKTLQTHENTDLTGITAVMNSILDEAKKIPKELPKEAEQKFIDYTKQFSALGDAVKSVEKVVKAQKLIAEAPVINVPETKVNVEAPNLKPLQKNIEDVVKAVNKIVIPVYKTDNKEVEKLIKASNKLLKGILERPISKGGGGGGRATPYKDTNDMPAFTDALESTTTAGVIGVVVVNPDGTNVGGAGGNLATAAKGATTAGNPTSTAASADRQLLDVTLRDTAGNAVAVGGGTQYADGAVRGTSTGTLSMGDDGTNIQSIKVDAAGELQVDVLTLPTITGSITANAGTNLNTSALALETGGNLATVKTNTDKIPALGQALAAASVPVVLTAAQLTTITPPAAITGYATSALQTQPGVDIGDVTINNAAGVAAVNIQDGGNTITVDGAVTTSGTVTEANSAASLTALQLIDNAVSGSGFNITQQGGVAVSLNTGVRDVGTQRVTIATNDVVPVTDNSGSLTVDAPVGTPVFVRLSDGASAIATLPVSLTSTTVTGTVATKEVRSATPTQSSPSVGVASTSILASNANRLGATIWNEAGVACLVKLGATASATSYSVSIAVGGYYEVPFGYTGAIDGITASSTATLRVTELVT